MNSHRGLSETKRKGSKKPKSKRSKSSVESRRGRKQESDRREGIKAPGSRIRTEFEPQQRRDKYPRTVEPFQSSLPLIPFNPHYPLLITPRLGSAAGALPHARPEDLKREETTAHLTQDPEISRSGTRQPNLPSSTPSYSFRPSTSIPSAPPPPLPHPSPLASLRTPTPTGVPTSPPIHHSLHKAPFLRGKLSIQSTGHQFGHHPSPL